ncbi:MAG TPA: cupin domain-containing protein [Acidimicrobiales bacterium]|nr:cupin domain-containing protein [Acidimicrobiales bacterium]
MKQLVRSSTEVEYGIPTQRNFPWEGVVDPPFGSMWGLLGPGQCTDLDVHDEHETVVISHGEGVITVGDEQRPVAAGDIVYIPPGVTHTLRNVADAELAALFVYWDDCEARA